MESAQGFLERVSAATPDELATILAGATEEQERLLRADLGEARFERMRALALQVPVVPSVAPERFWPFPPARPAPERPRIGNVVVLPGIMGSELTTISGGDRDLVWVNIPRIIIGRLSRLRLRLLGDGSVAEYDPSFRVEATGLYRRYYGELPLSLARRWNVREFSFDWRRGLDEAADALRAAIDRWFGPGTPVHLVAHSMGGLVCRTFIERHPDRWRTMWDRGGAAGPAGTRGGRLVMLGTPNHGSYLIPQAITGLASTVQLIQRFDQWHDLDGLLTITNSFVGTFQMLPSPLEAPEAESLYDPKTYRGLSRRGLEIPARVLRDALEHHRRLRGVIDPERMVYVAGSGQQTADGIADTRLFDTRLDAYRWTTAGDGSVSHRLGLLKGVTTYYVDSEHSALTSNASVLGALDALLQGQRPVGLAAQPPAVRALEAATEEAQRQAVAAAQMAALRFELAKADELVRRLEDRGRITVAPGVGVVPEAAWPATDPAEREAEEMLRPGFSGPVVVPAPVVPAPLVPAPVPELGVAVAPPVVPKTRLRIRPMVGDLKDAAKLPGVAIAEEPDAGELPVDAIAVGLYEGTRPSGVTRAIDRLISENLPGGARPESGSDDLLLTQFADRGILRGALAQPFLFPDPTDQTGKRLVVVLGLGRPGGCGVPELTVAVRELTWAVGRAGRRHVAAPLIGSGRGNLSIREAAEAWLRGLCAALTGGLEGEGRKLDVLTLYASSDTGTLGKAKLWQLREAIRQILTLEGLESLDVELLGEEPPRPSKAQLRRLAEPGPPARVENEPQAVRLSVGLRIDAQDPQLGIYQYGALTTDAAIPERSVTLDSTLVDEINDALPGLGDPRRQRDLGHLLGQILLPEDLRDGLRTDDPIVLQLDATTARIHWELVAQPAPAASTLAEAEPADDLTRFDPLRFLGTARGLTRQLRTTFAGPPEPPPPPIRTLRVLVVADPAADAPLPGAQAEGLAVARLFEAYNTVHANPWTRVEVETLIGPDQADRIELLNRLTTKLYHVLHFAGHCFFNADRPARSGWVFTGGRILSAFELRRIDRVPAFVFSNACESGKTPDRARERDPELVPSFAEAFFAKGVSNFVGTAWPIDDLAAVRFATTLYGRLLGLEPLGPDGEAGPGSQPPLEMHEAMRQAREAIATMDRGRGTWGAYQHYGNPFYRFFQPFKEPRPAEEPVPRPAGRRRGKRARRRAADAG
jgi:pimeloyl-ACP methyl ester carboxylesterase